MRKYFIDEETKKYKLSEYLEFDQSKFEHNLGDEELRKIRTEYIMSVIGDAKLDKEVYELFIKQFYRYGGRYNVRTRSETIKGMYDILQMYPFLAKDTLDIIWDEYISDLFEEYALDAILGEYIKLYGKTEKGLEEYLKYVDEVADEYKKKFDEESLKLELYLKDHDYCEDLISYLKNLIDSKHISIDKIISSLPSSELINKDREELIDISKKTRIYFAVSYPISYKMIECLATDQGLEFYPEELGYIINNDAIVKATFTKQEFLDSIKKEKVKRLEK